MPSLKQRLDKLGAMQAVRRKPFIAVIGGNHSDEELNAFLRRNGLDPDHYRVLYYRMVGSDGDGGPCVCNEPLSFFGPQPALDGLRSSFGSALN